MEEKGLGKLLKNPSDVLLALILLVIFILLVTRKFFKDAVDSFLDGVNKILEEALGFSKEVLNKAWEILTLPGVLIGIGVYFLLCPLIALVFFLVIPGMNNTAYFFLVLQFLLLCLPPLLFIGAKKKKDEYGFISKILLGFTKLGLCGLCLINLLVAVPQEIMGTKVRLLIFGAIVAFLFLNTILRPKWYLGWIAIYVLSVFPLLTYGAVNFVWGQERFQGIVNQHYANKEVVMVIITSKVPRYFITGTEDTNSPSVEPGTWAWVNFSEKIPAKEGKIIFPTHLDWEGGELTYLPLRDGVLGNYKEAKPCNCEKCREKRQGT